MLLTGLTEAGRFILKVGGTIPWASIPDCTSWGVGLREDEAGEEAESTALYFLTADEL